MMRKHLADRGCPESNESVPGDEGAGSEPLGAGVTPADNGAGLNYSVEGSPLPRPVPF
jgi:hypothetical protein